jgi:hypothetical protein
MHESSESKQQSAESLDSRLPVALLTKNSAGGKRA